MNQLEQEGVRNREEGKSLEKEIGYSYNWLFLF